MKQNYTKQVKLRNFRALVEKMNQSKNLSKSENEIKLYLQQ